MSRTALLLRHIGLRAIPLHGKLSQPKRLGALNKFRNKSNSILVATDVASRGLDIPHVDVVLNFDIPTHSKDYIHRVGRTARAGRSGRAITFVTQYDVELYQRIEALIGKKLPLYPTAEEEVFGLMERVSEGQRFAKMVCHYVWVWAVINVRCVICRRCLDLRTIKELSSIKKSNEALNLNANRRPYNNHDC